MTTTSHEGFRLSPGQRRLWRLRQAAPGGAWRARALVRLTGAVDPERLRAAAHRVTARHEALRTTFAAAPGLLLPVQVVGDPELGWSVVADAGSEGVADELYERAGAPRDPGVAPVLSLELARAADDAWWLGIGLPALCADRASLGRLVAELAAEYAGAGGGEGEEPLQHADVGEWQHDLLEGEETEPARQEWARWDPSGCLDLLPPFAAEAAGGFRPASVGVPVAADVAERLDELSGDDGESAWLTAWQLLLARWTGQDALGLGLAREGRGYEGLDESIGLLERRIPLDLELSGDASFRDLLATVAECRERRSELEDVFDWEAVAASRGVSPARVSFPLSFASFSVPGPWRAPVDGSDGVLFALERCEAWTDRVLLDLQVVRGTGDGRVPEVRLVHDASRLDRSAVEPLARAYAALAADLAAHPDAPVASLGLEAATAGAEAVEPVVETRPVHALFAEHAAREPARPAVVAGDGTVSYGELAERTARLASRLRRAGVAADDLVALFFDRSPGMVVGVLGTLTAGGAYLPLEPQLPEARRRLLLEDSGARWLVTEERLRDELGELPEGCELVLLDEEPAGDAPAAELAIDPAPADERLAYLIYTSGSTGTPKPVAVGHSQLAAYVGGLRERLGLREGASYALVSSFAADLGNTTLYSALAGGGTLHLLSEVETTEPGSWRERFAGGGIDVLKITPSHLEALLGQVPEAAALPRESLILGGEASRREWVEILRAAAPDVRVINHYGPTETTVGVLTHMAASGEPEGPNAGGTHLPLDRALPGTSVHRVDPTLRRVPGGFPGELVIGGAQVARGYLGRPAATALRFVPDPWADGPAAAGGRLYRTGDLARSRPDGGLELLGRIDDQVKVRGFRVEPGEVRAALAELPGVREAVVTVRAEADGARLAAYAVAEDGERLEEGWRAALAERLPPQMVPATLTLLESLPRLPNGKVDLRALPDPSTAGAAEHVAPRNPLEEVLAAVWCQVLDVDEPGVRDDFFALGGDSLGAIQVLTRVREIFGSELSLRKILHAPTIEGLAEALGETPEERERVEGIADVRTRLAGMSESEVEELLAAEAEVPAGTNRGV